MPNMLIRALRGVDVYSSRAQLTHNGSTRLKTWGGGLFTLITFILIAFYIFLIVTSPVKLENSDITSSTSSTTNTTVSSTSSSSSGSSSNKLSSSQFSSSIQTRMISKDYERGSIKDSFPMYPSWAIAVTPTFPIDPSVVSFEFYQINVVNGMPTNNLLNLVQCNSNVFPMKNFTRAENMYITYYFCPDATSAKFSGDPNTFNSSMFNFKVMTCYSGSCADDTTITSTLTGGAVMISMLFSYYDASNPADPIQQYIDDTNGFMIDLTSTTNIGIELDQQDVVFLNGSTSTFLKKRNISQFSTKIGTSKTLLNLITYLGPGHTINQQYQMYTPVFSRNLDSTTVNTNSTSSSSSTKQEYNSDPLYKAFFVMAQIGGFFSFLKIVFGGIVSLFSEKLFVIEVINKLKQLRNRKQNYRQANIKYKVDSSSKIKPINGLEEIKEDEAEIINCGADLNSLPLFQKKQTVLDNNLATTKKEDSDQIVYGTKDMIYSAVCCWRKRKLNTNKPIVTLMQRSNCLHQETAELYKAIDLAAMSETLKQLSATVNEMLKNGSKISVDEEFPFVKQDENIKNKDIYSVTKSQANYDQDKKKENISVSKAQNNQNASSSANRAKNTKSAYKEETKSINDIVSKELSVISDEILANKTNKANKPNDQDKVAKNGVSRAHNQDEKSFDFGGENPEGQKMIK